MTDAKQFTNNPVNVKAMQYDGTNHEAIMAFTQGKAKYQSAVGSSADGKGGRQSYSQLTLETQEGSVSANTSWIRTDIIAEGDYVVKSDSGHFYRQSEHVFKSSHSSDTLPPDVYDFRVIEQGTQYLIPK